ncbi:MAG TPA: TIGR04282 family arsenosugar biosynthesis glycosyltransferase [Polyangiaceae bacterium]|jgi:hypothetical protein|nr:TIGR04282 family arsenosugar biosynthesis glycosyltransferase [Polyangiaceae bacterium]
MSRATVSARRVPSARRPPRGLVLVFAKVPRAGHVKTRLAQRVGHDSAAELARAFLIDTLESLRSLEHDRVDVELALDASDAPAAERSRLLSTLGEPKTSDQGPGDLGARLERVLRRALETRPWALALGADCPGMPNEKVAEAIRLLEAAGGPDIVFGPARDGGYYSFGVRRFARGMLDGVRWGGESALVDSERGVTRAGLSSARTSDWFDVDEPTDLDHLTALLAARAIHAPATRRVLFNLEPWKACPDG